MNGRPVDIYLVTEAKTVDAFPCGRVARRRRSVRFGSIRFDSVRRENVASAFRSTFDENDIFDIFPDADVFNARRVRDGMKERNDAYLVCDQRSGAVF